MVIETGKKSKVVAKITKKKPTQKEMIFKLARQMRTMRKLVEQKIQAWDLANAQVGSAAGIVTHLMASLVQGTSVTTRVGNQVQLVYLMWRMQTNLLATTISGVGAVDFVLDKKPDGITQVVTEIYNGLLPKDLPTYDNRKRFKQLSHQPFTYDTGTLSCKGEYIKGYLDLRKYGHTQYTGNAGNVGDLADGTNDIILVYRSSNTSVGSTSYGIVADIRICFEDL